MTALLQCLLLISFFWFFGLPAIHRFRDAEVMVIHSKKDTNGIVAPSITVSARNPGTKKGWKDPHVSDLEANLLANQCGGLVKGELVECINRKAFNRTEVVSDAIIGFISKTSLGWLEDLTEMEEFGKTYTFDINRNIGTDWRTDQIFLLFGFDLVYDIFIHDPNFFILNYNPNGLPSLYIKIQPNASFNHYNKLSLTEHHEMNSGGDPCEEDPAYSFQVVVGTQKIVMSQ